MSSQRNAADRVRPFLHAMEQSILAARQRRLNSCEPSGQPPLAVAPVASATANPDDPNRPRLRARPKRPPNLVPSYDSGVSSSTS